jgi:hypothetical protein
MCKWNSSDSSVLFILFIFIVGLTPAIVSAYLTVRSERAAKQSVAFCGASSFGQEVMKVFDSNDDLHYVDGLGYMVGDITCDQNARSPYLRCAVNPMGPCDGCMAYEPRVYDRHF